MSTITFCINTARNELNHIKLLFHSLEQNLSTLDHEIVVFVDSDNQGTLEWLLTQKVVFPNLKILNNELPICYGYARNINEMFKFASNEIVSYLQSDMVVCKNYDLEVVKHLEPNMVLCSTRIEPPLHGNSGEKIAYDFGLDPTSFDLEAYTNYSDKQKVDQLTDYFFAPFTMYKSVWNDIGGHDTLFRRSREDSDILTRLVLNGTQIKQTWLAIVYHFTCTSSRGPKWFDKHDIEAQQRTHLQQWADSIELGRFFTKWGSFNHDLQRRPFYKVSAHITGQNLNLANLAVIQSYFSKIYVDSQHLVSFMQEHYDKDHEPANKLLNIPQEQWSEYSYMYNKLNASERFQLIQDNTEADDVIVRFNLQSLNSELFDNFITKIQDIINSVDEPGDYEYGPFSIVIHRKIDRSSEKIRADNPQIKPQHLYKVY